MNTILVSSHRRSGTHVLIDSLRKNIPSADFPNHALLPADFNLGSLFSKQERVYKIFSRLIDSPTPVIIKSHLLPQECFIKTPSDKYETLIRNIFDESQKLYISRDGRDVLISLYKFLKPSGSFSDFIREQNDHIVQEIRSFQDFDANRVAYWSHHVREWQKLKDVQQVSFATLMDDFQGTMAGILTHLGCEIPHTIEKPEIPRHLFWQGVQKKLHHFGLAKLPENSSVRPNKGSKYSGAHAFSEQDLTFYETYNKVTN